MLSLLFDKFRRHSGDQPLQGGLRERQQISDAHQSRRMSASRIDPALRLPQKEKHEADRVNQPGYQRDLGMLSASAPEPPREAFAVCPRRDHVAPQKPEGGFIRLNLPNIPHTPELPNPARVG